MRNWTYLCVACAVIFVCAACTTPSGGETDTTKSSQETSAESDDLSTARNEQPEPLFTDYERLPEGVELAESAPLSAEFGYSRGGQRAPVTVVAFVDQEAVTDPGTYILARGLEARSEGRVRLVVHPILSADEASGGELPEDVLSRALVAAGRQDAYWEFEELAFDERAEWREAVERERHAGVDREIDKLEAQLEEAKKGGNNDRVTVLRHQIGRLERLRQQEGPDEDGPMPDELLESWAEKLDLDVEQFDEDRRAEKTERRLLANTLRARRLSAHDGGLFVNGRFVKQDGMHLGGNSPIATYRGLELKKRSSELMAEVNEAFDQAEGYRKEKGDADRMYSDLVRQNLREHPAAEAPRQRLEDDRVARLSVYDRTNDRISDPWSGTERKVAHDPTIGARNDYLATVVLACDPYFRICAGGVERLEELEETFGDRVRFVYKPKRSLGASGARAGGRTWDYRKLLVAAEQLDAYPQMHRAVGEAVADAEDPSLAELAQRAGLEADTLREAVESSEVVALLDQNRLMLEESADLVSGPVIFVNGIAVEGQFAKNGIERFGIPPRAYLEDLIEEQIELAEHIRGRVEDVTASDLYMTLAELNAEAPPEVPSFDFEFEVDTDALDFDRIPGYGPREADIEVIAFHGLDDGRSARAHQTFQLALESFAEEVRLHWVYRQREDTQLSHDEPGMLRALVGAERDGHFDVVYPLLLDYRFLGAPPDWPRYLQRQSGLDLAKLAASAEVEEGNKRQMEWEKMAEEAGVYAAPVYVIGDEVIVGAAPLGEYLDALEAAAADEAP